MRELSTSSLYVITNGNNNLKNYKTLLGSIPLDAMRNNSSKLVNQDMDVVPLEEMNLTAERILRQVAENMHDSKLMSRYVEELTKKDREKWRQSQICMSMMKGGETPSVVLTGANLELPKGFVRLAVILDKLIIEQGERVCQLVDAHL